MQLKKAYPALLFCLLLLSLGNFCYAQQKAFNYVMFGNGNGHPSAMCSGTGICYSLSSIQSSMIRLSTPPPVAQDSLAMADTAATTIIHYVSQRTSAGQETFTFTMEVRKRRLNRRNKDHRKDLRTHTYEYQNDATIMSKYINELPASLQGRNFVIHRGTYKVKNRFLRSFVVSLTGVTG